MLQFIIDYYVLFKYKRINGYFFLLIDKRFEKRVLSRLCDVSERLNRLLFISSSAVSNWMFGCCFESRNNFI